MKKVTLQDIAEELGVSKGTVDRAIHDRPGVSYETKQKVLNLIKKYNYQPNRVARSLSLKSKGVKIGVIYQTFPEHFWGNVDKGLKAAERELSDFGLSITYKNLYQQGRNSDEIVRCMDELIEENVDAIALVPVDTEEIRNKIEEAIEGRIVVATLNDDISNSKRMFYVGPQMKQSGRIAGELIGKFLKAKGSVIVLDTGIESLEYKARIEGFKETLDEKYKDINIAAFHRIGVLGEDANSDDDIKNALESYDYIDAIYNIDGSTLDRIGYIIKSSRKLSKVILVGHEISNNVNNLLQDGAIYACISQDPYSQGYYIIKFLFDYFFDGTKPVYERMYTRLDVILAENVIKQNNIVNPYYV